MSSPIKPERIRVIKDLPHQEGSVVYWMSRDQRVNDNWALLFSQALANKYKSSLAVVFCLVSEFLEATIRQYGFMMKGLQQIEASLNEKNIPFYCLFGSPEREIQKFCQDHVVTKLVSDFNPLKIHKQWKSVLIGKVNATIYEVDAHNIIPAWITSEKQEFGAYTIRPKIHRLLPTYLEEFPPLRKQNNGWKYPAPKIDWAKIEKSLKINRNIKEVDWLIPGESNANKSLKDFINNRLAGYDEKRNDPTLDGQSNISPYLHFGQISAQQIALEIVHHSGKDIQTIVHKNKNGSVEKKGNEEAFLEELIVRRELSDNFTFYNPNYDSFEGFPEWANRSLNEHRKDKREYIYTLEQFEKAETHDPLWNAAQIQMMTTGKMHGYMRMYWAKKILEWSLSPEEALVIGIYLNDKYQLDGRDPNGYTGIAWSIGGVHDRAWFERTVYGKIRYMNFNGCVRKFDVKKYIAQNNIPRNGP